MSAESAQAASHVGVRQLGLVSYAVTRRQDERCHRMTLDRIQTGDESADRSLFNSQRGKGEKGSRQ